MKTRQEKFAIIAAVVGVSVIAGLMPANAQETAASGTTASADSIVAIAADSQSLREIAPANVPERGGTFWWVYPGGDAIPAPSLPLNFSAPIYGITSQSFLVDLTGGTVSVTPYQLAQAELLTTNAYAAAVTAQVTGLIDLVTMVQTAATNSTETTASAATTVTALDTTVTPMDSETDVANAAYPYLTIGQTGTNQLLINVVNTNSGTYYLQMTPVLGDTNYPFSIVANGVAGQSNFTVNVGPYQNEFFRVLMTTNIPGSGIAVYIDSPANGATVQ